MSGSQTGRKNGVWYRMFGPASAAPCFWCAKSLTFREATLDHEPPRSEGGDHFRTVIACRPCNQRRNREAQLRRNEVSQAT